jgi:hypothetical protein
MFVMLEMSLRCTATPTHPYREESMKLCMVDKALLAAVPRKPLTQLQRQNHGGLLPSFR